MDKQQLTKEVLKLKSQGLSKEQIKSILIKSNNSIDEFINIKKQSDYSDFMTDIRTADDKPINKNDIVLKQISNYILNEPIFKNVKVCGISKHSDYTNYIFTTGLLSIDINDYVNGSITYKIKYGNTYIDYNVGNNEIDLLNSIPTEERDVYFSTLLRWVCFGIVNDAVHKPHILDSKELLYFIKNIRNYDLNQVKSIIIKYDSNGWFKLKDLSTF